MADNGKLWGIIMATFTLEIPETLNFDIIEGIKNSQIAQFKDIELTNNKLTDLIVKSGSLDIMGASTHQEMAQILCSSLVKREDALKYLQGQFPNWPIEKLKNGKLNICGKDHSLVLHWAKESPANHIIRRGICNFAKWESENLRKGSWLFLTEDEKQVKKEQAKAKTNTKDNRSIAEVVSDSNKALDNAVKTGNNSDAVPGTTGTPIPLKTSILASELLEEEEEENTVDIPSIIPTTSGQKQGLSDIKILANFYEYAKASGKYSLDSISDLGIVFENMASELGIETPFV